MTVARQQPTGRRLDTPMSAKQIRDIRHALGMNQEYFAFHVGVSKGCVSDWERGVNKISRLGEFAVKSMALSHGLELGRFGL